MDFIKSGIQLIRPIQWIKNLLVLSGILFGGEFFNVLLWEKVLLAMGAFCLVSSAIYVLNDIFDRNQDKIHPKKKHRPIASGKITVQQGWAFCCFCALVGLWIGSFVSLSLLCLLVAYLILNIAYTVKLKHVVILDVFCISAGFMLRLLAGTIGVGIPPSHWLLLCGIMVTLFLGFAKRRAELVSKSFTQKEHRRVLEEYNVPYLDYLITICITGTILTYSLYTMSEETIRAHHTENLIFTVPFVIYALFRYLYLIHEQKSGGDPTNDLIRDKHIAFSFLAWLVLTIAIIQG